jgi:hypothetical protein
MCLEGRYFIFSLLNSHIPDSYHFHFLQYEYLFEKIVLNYFYILHCQRLIVSL